MHDIKDILYEISDIILAIIVLLIIILTIGWQLYGWFQVNKEGTLGEKSEVAQTINQANDENDKKASLTDVSNDLNQKIEDKTISFEIKPGDSGAVVAYNLKKLHLIPTQKEFLNTVQSLGLDGKLRAGTYDLKTSYSMDQIAKILSK